MLAIYKKELKTYFSTMIGYAFIAFFSLVVGFVFYYINVLGATAFVGYALRYAYIAVVMMVLVPVLTMKIFADERHSKTDQMLFTAPVTVGRIVMGKFLAVATVFTIPVLVMLIYPLIMSDYASGVSKTPIGANYAAIIGFWLMGLALFAIGCFVSSVTENQIISAVVTFAILLFIFILQYISGIFPTDELASAIAICLFIGIFALVYWLIAKKTTKNALMHAGIIAVAGIAVVIILYFVNGSMFDGLLQNILLRCSVYYMYSYYFSAEIIDIGSLVYFVSVIGFFLFLTVQSVQKRRWS